MKSPYATCDTNLVVLQKACKPFVRLILKAVKAVQDAGSQSLLEDKSLKKVESNTTTTAQRSLVVAGGSCCNDVEFPMVRPSCGGTSLVSHAARAA